MSLTRYKITNQLFVLILLAFVACTPEQKLKEGDILFRGAKQEKLSQAIDQVTKGNKNKIGFSHVGVLFKHADSLVVYHSNPEYGAHISSIKDFTHPDSTSNLITAVYRIPTLTLSQLQQSQAIADSHLGEPYNFSYIFEDKGLYCSEYVYEIFADLDVFKLNPMTFKNANDTIINPTWQAYYNKMGIDVPEGKLGCNPNGMSQNKALTKVMEIR